MKANVHTQYSSHANTIADTFRAAFAQTKVGDHSVEMTAPEGSTQGGRLALQHVTLKPPVGMALVVGSLNAGDKHAELRSFASVAQMHAERFKRPVPFDEGSYAAFVETARTILAAFGIALVVIEPTAPVRSGSAPDAKTSERMPASSGANAGAASGSANTSAGTSTSVGGGPLASLRDRPLALPIALVVVGLALVAALWTAIQVVRH